MINHWRILPLVALGCLLTHATAAPTTRPAIDLSPTQLDAIVGQYQLAPDQSLSITRFRNHLYAQITGRRPFPIFPETDTSFFYRDIDAHITIEKDAHGKVNGARYDRGTTHQSGKKISDLPPDPANAPEILDSPRLSALAKQIDAGDPTALTNFWTDVQDHAPLIEPSPGDSRYSSVTFLFRGDAKTRAVRLEGGPVPASRDGRAQNLTRLRDTDLWYRTLRIPNDARFMYGYQVNLSGRMPDTLAAEAALCDANARPDPLNPNFVEIPGSIRPVMSVLELPDAPPQLYARPDPGTPRGTVTTGHKIQSDTLHEQRTYSLYTPPGYDANGDPYPLVILFDGFTYYSDAFIPGPTIIDNLIAAKKIPPLVVVFVDQINRGKDLNCSNDFVAFLVNELIPRLRAEQHVTSDPAHTTIGGSSMGGLMASYCALRHPDVFGNVISQSGSYSVYPGALNDPPAPNEHGGALASEFVRAPKLPIRFYLDAGRFEDALPPNLLGENRRLRDVLLAKGYDVTYAESPGGHDFINWRTTLPNALIAVTQLPKK